jgi:hypothetical protein
MHDHTSVGHGDRGNADEELNIYSVVLIDVKGSTSRDGPGFEQMREDLSRLVVFVAHEGGIRLELQRHGDTGDGFRLVLAPREIAPHRVIDVFVDRLATRLRDHNNAVSDARRIRLRVAFHLGMAKRRSGTWTGPLLIVAERLVNAEQVRGALEADDKLDLVAIVSNELYETVVVAGFGQIPVRSYQRVHVSVKEFDRDAWLLVPDPAARWAVARL